MDSAYTPSAWVQPLRRALPRPLWQNLVLLIVAIQFARTFIGRQLALGMICTISSGSCYRRLQRLLGKHASLSQRLARVWVRLVVRVFAPGRGRLNLLIDWTWHTTRCRSLWIMLPVGGRAVPLAFWLAPPALSGKGSQRAFEDEAMRQLRQWLPRGRRALLIGDRGFGGLDRMHFLRGLGFHFLLRVQGQTQIRVPEAWIALREAAPPIGQRKQWEGVLLGKQEARQRQLPVNVIAVRQELLRPKRVCNWKGKPTGKTTEETTWFLITDLPLGTDAVALYQLRMQIEETFRDYKAVLGLEQEATQRPWERLGVLLWALMIGMALDLKLGGAAPAKAPRAPRISRQAREAPAPVVPAYRSESALREGLHALLVQVVLGPSLLRDELAAVATKAEHMKARPQVRERRRGTPEIRSRVKSNARIHV
jgi:DDE family transposase